ncbi:MAG: ABC transporter ATP-binding protein [Gammaproteobacteria bacterium]|nr:ABC transporter ATP-binding protein [Gammaproteobacteria bacterium]
MTLLRVQNLQAWYHTSHILHGIDLEIKASQCMGLLGRNGMGKTTLIRCIMGLVPKMSGSITMDGEEISSWDTFKRTRLGLVYVPEGRGIFPNLKVFENLLVGVGHSHATQVLWNIDKIWDLFPRLAERRNHYGNLLSGGEQQMLAIARALMAHPRLLILDEATEGLAPLVVHEIWGIIEYIQQQGVSTLVVDRDWRRVLHHSHHGMVLQKGRLVLSDSAQQILNSSQLTEYLGV